MGQIIGATAPILAQSRRAPGSGGDVSRALYTVPSVVQVDSSANDLVVRGGSPFENGFCVDNIPFPNVNHFPLEGASGGNIGILNVDFIDDLRLLVGGFGARYGSRLSSIVDIRYREGDRASSTPSEAVARPGRPRPSRSR